MEPAGSMCSRPIRPQTRFETLHRLVVIRVAPRAICVLGFRAPSWFVASQTTVPSSPERAIRSSFVSCYRMLCARSQGRSTDSQALGRPFFLAIKYRRFSRWSILKVTSLLRWPSYRRPVIQPSSYTHLNIPTSQFPLIGSLLKHATPNYCRMAQRCRPCCRC